MLHGKVTQSSDTRLLSYIYQHHQYCQNNCSQHHHHRNTRHFLSFFIALSPKGVSQWRSQPQRGVSVALSPKGGSQWRSQPQRGISVTLSAPTGDLSGTLSPKGGSQWRSQASGCRSTRIAMLSGQQTEADQLTKIVIMNLKKQMVKMLFEINNSIMSCVPSTEERQERKIAQIVLT